MTDLFIDDILISHGIYKKKVVLYKNTQSPIEVATCCNVFHKHLSKQLEKKEREVVLNYPRVMILFFVVFNSVCVCLYYKMYKSVNN